MKSAIKIAHVHLENPMIISEEYVQLLVVENPGEFYRTVSALDSQMDGGEGDFAFSREDKLISPEKSGVMISDLFHFDLNDKKLVNLLYKRLDGVALGDKVAQFNELQMRTVSFLEELSFCVPFALDYDEISPTDYLKAAGVKFDKVYDSLEEKLICYINAWIELKGCEFFVFVNLKSVLDDEKLQQIYAHCRAEQVGLLLVESGLRRPILPCEKAIVITEDLCEILANHTEMC